MDMAGNAWEWMYNLYRKGEIWRALRGGSWNFNQLYLRCSARNNDPPYIRDYFVGFRVVRRLLPQSLKEGR
jgi:formylglycine-generating enzyme required for sulfatase activity